MIGYLQYANQDSTLHDMYLNLLARSMDDRVAETLHPAFAAILRELSPAEAVLLPLLWTERPFLPLVEARVPMISGGFKVPVKHINVIGSRLEPETLVRASVIDNLVRVGVLAIQNQLQIQNDDSYREIEEGPIAKAIIESAANTDQGYSFHRYLAEITEFGEQFLKAVLDDPDDSASTALDETQGTDG